MIHKDTLTDARGREGGKEGREGEKIRRVGGRLTAGAATAAGVASALAGRPRLPAGFVAFLPAALTTAFLAAGAFFAGAFLPAGRPCLGAVFFYGWVRGCGNRGGQARVSMQVFVRV